MRLLNKNFFYALGSRGEQEESTDVVTGMLQVFSIDVYALLYPGATLSFISTLVDKTFHVLPDILIEPFIVTTPIGDFIMARRIFWCSFISSPKELHGWI